jgi:hypothetical protein
VRVTVPAQAHLAIGWKTVVAPLVLALLGKIVEVAAGAVGVARAGGSKRGAAVMAGPCFRDGPDAVENVDSVRDFPLISLSRPCKLMAAPSRLSPTWTGP